MEQVTNYLLWLKSRGLISANQHASASGSDARKRVLVVTDEASTYQTLLTAILRAINLSLADVQVSSDPLAISFEDFSHIINFGLNIANVPESVNLVSTATLSQLDNSKELKKSLWHSLIRIKNDFIP